jgi:hypothetical protein
MPESVGLFGTIDSFVQAVDSIAFMGKKVLGQSEVRQSIVPSMWERSLDVSLLSLEAKM